jgi:polar amino acid transport system permease protein
VSYHLNFAAVWRNFGRLGWGLALSLELAAIGIAAGVTIGLALALLAQGRGRIVRTLIAAYVEFIRNVPLLLLVYLVFYGIPSVGGFAYSATTSFVVTLSIYAGAYLVEVFRAGRRAGHRADAMAAHGVCADANDVAHRPSLVVERVHLLVQGHRHRLGDRRA